jgi:hypothetical protein
MNDKNIRVNLGSIASVLDKEQFEILIDAMVEKYVELYGLDNLTIDEPIKPDYDCENLSEAKSYLKKFQLK